MTGSPLASVARATQDYVAQYADPITVARGAQVRVDREDDAYRGWWWCAADDGRAGWVPEDLLDPPRRSGGVSRVRDSYTARELSVHRGETLVVEAARAGWVFVRNASGEAGWVPASHVHHLPEST